MTSAIKFRAEFKPLLSVVNILLEFPRSMIIQSPRVTIEAHSVSVQTEESTIVCYLESLTLKPHTCRGLRWNSLQELQLSLQAESNESENKNGHADEIKPHNHNFSNQEVLVSKIQACQSRCYCAGCGAHILKSSCNFQRVLPLPSENWTDFADIWFCHNHQSDSKTHDHSHHNHSGDSTLPGQLRKVKDSGLSPRPDDCLVSSLYMLVSARQVKSCAVLCTTDRIICKRCGNFLGFVKLGDADSGDHNLHSYFHDPLNGVYKLYFHAVSFGGNLEEHPVPRLKVPQDLDSRQIVGNNHDQSVESFICHLLKDQSHLYTSFRFIIDSSCQRGGQGGMLILLWLLDQELDVFLQSLKVEPSSSTSDVLPGPSSPSTSDVLPGPSSPSTSDVLPEPSSPSTSDILPEPSSPSTSDVLPEPSSPSTSDVLPGPSSPSTSDVLTGPSSPSTSDILPKPQSSHVHSFKLASCKYMKLLYKSTFLLLNESHSGKPVPPTVFTAWQKDNTVHGISLPYPLCKQLINLLVSSTKQLTRSQRSLNGFHVGYLQVS